MLDSHYRINGSFAGKKPNEKWLSTVRFACFGHSQEWINVYCCTWKSLEWIWDLFVKIMQKIAMDQIVYFCFSSKFISLFISHYCRCLFYIGSTKEKLNHFSVLPIEDFQLSKMAANAFVVQSQEYFEQLVEHF